MKILDLRLLVLWLSAELPSVLLITDIDLLYSKSLLMLTLFWTEAAELYVPPVFMILRKLAESEIAFCP